MDPSATSSVTEFAIVVAGFTGLVLAIGARDGATNPLVKLRTITMLFYAFTAAFGSLLPTLFTSLEVQNVWELSALSLAILLVANMAATIIGTRVLLTIEQRPQLAGWMWSLVLGGNTLFTALLLCSLLGILNFPITGAFFGALIWQLVLSTILFTRIVLRA
jgi:hypothetical protein